jgi:hypothetical protein
VNDETFPVEHYAAKAKVSPRTLRREILAGNLVATRIRGAVRISPADWEEYLKKCRSVVTEKDGRYEFSTAVVDLPVLLRLGKTRCSSRADGASKPTTGERVVRLPTQSRKHSTAG